MPSANLPAAQSAARRAFLAPAHPSKNNGEDVAITELKITPQALNFATKKPMSRRERRRLRRPAASK
jgi:hypothetical protein